MSQRFSTLRTGSSTHRTLGAALAGVAAGALVAGGIAVATVPSSTSGQITACYRASTGALRIIDVQRGQKCRSGERALTWGPSYAWRGAWSSTRSYPAGSVVVVRGATYVARIAVPAGRAPAGTGTTWWGLLAAAGATGATGATGPTGAAGTAGTDGRTILSGTLAPDARDGSLGDYYLLTTTHVLYGPKSARGWGAGTSLVGPAGPAGTVTMRYGAGSWQQDQSDPPMNFKQYSASGTELSDGTASMSLPGPAWMAGVSYLPTTVRYCMAVMPGGSITQADLIVHDEFGEYRYSPDHTDRTETGCYTVALTTPAAADTGYDLRIHTGGAGITRLLSVTVTWTPQA